ncbi:MAG: LAGLIDADG family homing endonuclease [Candidatus Heimdallarchaeota archaeon]|nr:LAGLIDADG family homing endonuclease [Candidatus Heimdallarchaeota archaeon]
MRYFHGDGCVRTWRNSICITMVSGSKDFLDSLTDVLTKNSIKTSLLIDMKQSGKLLWILRVFAKSGEKFYRKLYENNGICLERKKIIFDKRFK